MTISIETVEPGVEPDSSPIADPADPYAPAEPGPLETDDPPPDVLPPSQDPVDPTPDPASRIM